MAPYIPISQLKLDPKAPASSKVPTSVDRSKTTDEKGNVIQVNGKNVASVNSPYNPSNIQDQKMLGSLATFKQNLMGSPAKVPASNTQSNVIAPKYAAPATTSTPPAGSNMEGLINILKNSLTTTTPPATGSNRSPTAPTSPTTTPTPNRDDTSRSGLLSTLVSQSNQRNRELADKAQKISATAGQTMSDIGRQGAAGAAGYRTTGTSPIGEGNAAVLNQSTAAQQQAVAQGAQTELQGIGYGLQGQGQTQSALQSALGYQQPMSQFGVLVNPGDASPVGGGTAQSAAFAGGQTQASVGMGSQYAANSAAQAGANNQVASLTGIDISNPSNLPALNSLLQTWQNEGVSGPNAQNLRNVLSSINSAYSTILGYNIDVDTLSRSSGQTIGEVLQKLNDLANQKQEGLKNVGTGMGGVTTPNTTGGSTGGGGLFDW